MQGTKVEMGKGPLFYATENDVAVSCPRNKGPLAEASSKVGPGNGTNEVLAPFLPKQQPMVIKRLNQMLKRY